MHKDILTMKEVWYITALWHLFFHQRMYFHLISFAILVSFSSSFANFLYIPHWMYFRKMKTKQTNITSKRTKRCWKLIEKTQTKRKLISCAIGTAFSTFCSALLICSSYDSNKSQDSLFLCLGFGTMEPNSRGYYALITY